MKYMTQSFKPTLFTFIPIIIIFSWLSAHLAFYPIAPDTTFSTTVFLKDGMGMNATLSAPEEITIISDAKQKINAESVTWKLKGKEGKYNLEYEIGDKVYEKDVVITKTKEYAKVDKLVNDDLVNSIKINNEPIKAMNLFGWKVGWLGSYIIFSIIFSMLLRKWMKLA